MPTDILRPRFGPGLAVAVWACCAVALVLTAAGGAWAAAARLAVPLAAVCVLTWTVFWRPQLEVSDGEVVVVNPWRTVHVPWPALAGVSTAWSLTVLTTGGRTVSCWAAPAPSAAGEGTAAMWASRGSQRAEQHVAQDAGGAGKSRGGLSGDGARLITTRRARLTAAGYLDDIRPEGAVVRDRWHTATIAAVAALALAEVALRLL